MKKLAVAIVSLLLLITACQTVEVRSDADKQLQIESLYRRYTKEFPHVKGIAVTELQELLDRRVKIVLVDVRSPAEIAVSYIPEAIDVSEFEANLAQYQDATVIAYCTIGYRSGLYAQKLQQQGIEVLNLEGSLLAWSHVDGKLTNGRTNVRKVHVFGRQWQLTPKTYEAVW
ncbi:MAG: rhodanese-like domain-containing protein [Cyanobacteria bacterium J06600_6]